MENDWDIPYGEKGLKSWWTKKLTKEDQDIVNEAKLR